MSGAQIHDRGYRRYEGERRAAHGSTVTLYLASLQRVLGLRRGAKAKVIPVLTIAISYLPAIAFIGMASLLPDKLNGAIPKYNEYYGFVVSAILLFVAFVAPEVLCPDRRYRILGVYLASPLTRRSYVVAKLASVLTVLAAVTIGPLLVLTIARTLLDSGPAPENLPVLMLRIIAGGALLSIYYGSLALAISSFTSRKGFASAGIVLLTVVTQAIGAVLGTNGNGNSRAAILASISVAPFEAVQRIFGVTTGIDASTTLVVVIVVGTIALSLAILFEQYHRMEVTR
jgi:ABC-2 type transport system permease protein